MFNMLKIALVWKIAELETHTADLIQVRRQISMFEILLQPH